MKGKINIRRCFVITILSLLVMVCPSLGERVIYVDANALGANNGTSWTNAYKYLQDALSVAKSGDEIHVSKGIYTPDRGVGFTLGDKFATFCVKNGVTIKGGFAGFREPDPNSRDIEKYKTTLSGDLAGNDIDVEDPCDLANEPTRFDNSLTVLTGKNIEQFAILDGFTIAGGHNSVVIRDGPYGGAGMLNESSSPTLIDCTFIENALIYYGSGGGLSNLRNSNPTLINCKFIRNYATSGGGIGNDSSTPKLINCIFYDNYARSGGAMYNRNSNPVINGCNFISNSNGAFYNSNSNPMLLKCTFVSNNSGVGAGIYNENSCSILTDCKFIGNTATLYGGGLFNGEGSYPSLFHCIFTGNSAERGGAIFNLRRNSGLSVINCTFSDNSARLEGSVVYSYGEIIATSCIFWSNVDTTIVNKSGKTVVKYSDIEGGWPGEGNIDADPCFGDPNNGDYHLKSQAGRWDPNSQSWIQDNVTSPCIDAGDPNIPIGSEPFPNGGRINMGAYGGTIQASKSYFGSPVCETIVAGDINGDCKVDFKDFQLMAVHWLAQQ